MNCPVCDESMRKIDKHGVNLDICPTCKGVWLDKGELERIIEMASSGMASMDTRGDTRSSDQSYGNRNEHREHGEHDDHDSHERRSNGEFGHGDRKKRGSWLGDILGGFGGD